MKITAVETHVCHARMRNWVFVKVLTDQPGLYGWGEATLEWHTRAIVGAIEDLAELIVGEDPTRIEHLWQMMYRQHFWHGNGHRPRHRHQRHRPRAVGHRWARSHGVPCHKLWGGPVRDYVRTYCHLGGGRMEDFYETTADDAQRFAELARQAVEEGFTAFKSMAVPPTMPIEGLRPIRLRRSLRRRRCATRWATTSTSWSTATRGRRPRWACSSPQALEPFGLYLLRRAVLAGERRRHWPTIQRARATPIATGERLTQLAAFRDLLAQRALQQSSSPTSRTAAA